MLLSARMLNDVQNVNSFDFVQVAQLTAGDAQDIYFQITDASKNPAQPVYMSDPSGFRYMPAAGSTLQVVLRSIDDAKTVTRWASQPFAQDPSIWKLTVTAQDVLVGTFGLRLALTEPQTGGGSRVTRGILQQAVQIRSLSSTFC